MVDPLAEVVALLRPRAPFTKVVSGAGRWGVRRTEYGQPFYCVILEGLARLSIDGQELTTLEAGDFVLIPSTPGFAMTSSEPPPPEAFSAMPLLLPNGEYRHGDPAAAADIRFLVGHWVFDSPDTALLVSLLPRWVHVRAEPRLSMIVQLVGDESRAQRPARDVILEHLLEVLMIEALRSSSGSEAPPGLLRGLADERLAAALRRMHQSPSEPWTVAQLAKESALSRSTFFDRFQRALGVAPMEYLLAWRMALAKRYLRHRQAGVADVAASVGYSSASTFTVAFTRHAGLSPAQYARAAAKPVSA
jgi:AraC-like DNA-binding protein